jgi:subtilisin family serine protease
MKRFWALITCLLVLSLAVPVSAKNQDDKAKPGNQNSTTSLPANAGRKNSAETTVPAQKNDAQDTPVAKPVANGQSDANDKANRNAENKAQSPAKSENSNGGAKKSQIKENSNPRDTDGENSPSVANGNSSFIVRFVKNASSDAAAKAMIDAYNEDVKKANKNRPAKNALKRGVVKQTFEKVLNAAVIEVPESAVAGLLRNPRVLSIEADSSVMVEPVSSTQVGATWGIDRIDQRTLPLNGAFSSPSTANNVSIYVVDTGIDASHPEFTGRVASGFDSSGLGDGRTDCNSHGTHVAGIAAGSVHGVAKSARLVPVRVLACDGSGSISGVIAGLEWIASTRTLGERSVVNMSLGGGASSSLDAAVASLISTGVTVVVAAGNSNVDACTSSPARTAPAITVGSTTSTDSRSSFSNYGPCVDLFAPGSEITAAVPGGGTAVLSGTSMAAPHVAGIAAIALSIRNMSPSEMSVYLSDSGTKSAVVNAGTGSTNILAYLPQVIESPTGSNPTPLVSIPSQPGAPLAEPRSKAAIVSWQFPNDGGSAITAFVVRAYSEGRVVLSVTVSGSTSTTRVTRLRNGVGYTFTVQARNAVGSSSESLPSATIFPTR